MDLKQIVQIENGMRKVMGQKLMAFPINNQEDADTIFKDIDCRLSPENLHCDGEISASQADYKYRQLMKAVRKLKKQGFKVPDGCWEIN
jgi:hypothetical protein